MNGITDADDNWQVLGSVADTFAQLITAFKVRRRMRQGTSSESISWIEFEDLDKGRRGGGQGGELGYPDEQPPEFDFERLIRFMSYGFFMAPIQFHWFKFLSRTFPLTKARATVPALQRVGVDQFIFAPFGMYLECFYYSTWAKWMQGWCVSSLS